MAFYRLSSGNLRKCIMNVHQRAETTVEGRDIAFKAVVLVPRGSPMFGVRKYQSLILRDRTFDPAGYLPAAGIQPIVSEHAERNARLRLYYDIGKTTCGKKGTVGPLCFKTLRYAEKFVIKEWLITHPDLRFLKCVVTGQHEIQNVMSIPRTKYKDFVAPSRELMLAKLWGALTFPLVDDAPQGTIACWSVTPIEEVDKG